METLSLLIKAFFKNSIVFMPRNYADQITLYPPNTAGNM